jgi:type IV secretory pathway VirB2 component (pilin)
MLGNLGTILQQIAQALTTGTIPVALATIAIAVVGILWALGRISLMMMAGVVVGIIIIGSAATIAPQLITEPRGRVTDIFTGHPQFRRQ